MSISAVSGSSTLAPVAPLQQSQQSQQVKPAPPAAKADSVSISKQAQQLASDGDTAAQEFAESAAEKAGEALRGKK
jgi:hypothetical protein